MTNSSGRNSEETPHELGFPVLLDAITPWAEEGPTDTDNPAFYHSLASALARMSTERTF